MPTPIVNWRSKIDDVELLYDVADRKLRYFLPRLKWRELSRRDIGGRLAVFSGEIDLGFNSDELGQLSLQLPGVRLQPVALRSATSDAKVKIQISQPHKASLQLSNRLPYPSVVFSATIDLRSPDGANLATEIEVAWQAKAIASGGIKSEFMGRRAVGGFNVSVDYRECRRSVSHGIQGADRLSNELLLMLVRSYVDAGDSDLIEFVGLNEVQAERAIAKSYLTEKLASGIIVSCEPMARYDNGEQLLGYCLRDEKSLKEVEKAFCISSSEVTERANFRLD